MKNIIITILVIVPLLLIAQVEPLKSKYFEFGGTIMVRPGMAFSARDSMKFVPGFSFDANGTGPTTFDIDPSLYFPAEYIDSTHIVDPTTRTHNKSLAVGSTNGNFSVSSSGNASYNIPIAVSPGTNGVAPGLAITYNSGSIGGNMGVGWNLSGISAIIRTGSDLYHDGQNKEVKLNGEDHFSLNGNRLIKTSSGTYGANEVEYGMEHENFSVITSYGNVGGGPAYFIVEDKGGNQYYYGKAEAESKACLESDNANAILAWYLYKVVTVDGNYIRFNYEQDKAIGETWLTRVDYTGNDGINLAPYNKVEVYYQERPDIRSYRVNGATFTSSRLVRQVVSFSDDGVYRKYVPKYYFNNQTYLNELIEYNAYNECYNSLAFSYEDNAPVMGDEIATIGSGIYELADFDGDGIDDIIITEKGSNTFGVKVKETGSAHSSNPYYRMDYSEELGETTITTIPVDTFYMIKTGEEIIIYDTIIETEHFSPNWDKLLTGDFDGDGKKDIIIADAFDSYSEVYLEPSSINNEPYRTEYETVEDPDPIPGSIGGGSVTVLDKAATDSVFCYFSSGNGFGYNSETQIFTEQNMNSVVIDFNGDGYDDVMFYNFRNDEYKVFLGKSSGNFLYNKSVSSLSGLRYQPKFADFNGDGMIDILVHNYDNYKAYSLSGETFSTLLGSFSLTLDNILVPVDIDGDGISELLINETDIGYFKDGNLVVEPANEYDLPDNNYTSYFTGGNNKQGIKVDLNRDGRQDMIMFKTSPVSSVQKWKIDLFINTQTGFELANSIQSGTTYLQSVDVSDVDGNGVLDLIYLTSTDQAGTNTKMYREEAGLSMATKKMNSIVDGFNKLTKINYRASNSYRDSDRATTIHAGTSSSGSKVPNKRSVVSGYTVSKGDEVFADISYNYFYPVTHKKGLGFLGYGLTEQVNNITHQINTTNVVLATSYYLPWWTRSWTSFGRTNHVAKNEKWFRYADLGNGRTFSYIYSNKSDNLLAGTFNENRYVFDDYGNITTFHSILNNEGTVTTENYYSIHGTNYPAHIDSSRVTKNLGQIVPGEENYNSRKTAYTYSGTKLQSATSDPGTTKAITTNFSYYPSGALFRKDVVPTNAASSFQELEYDGYFRFVTKSTTTGNFTNEFWYDDFTGNLLESTDIDGITTR